MSYVVCRYAPCTNVFWARNRVHKYCSKACCELARWRRSRTTPFERRCRDDKCQKLFMPYRGQVYCSTYCKNRHLRDLNRDHRNKVRRAYYARNREHILAKRRQARRKAAA